MSPRRRRPKRRGLAAPASAQPTVAEKGPTVAPTEPAATEPSATPTKPLHAALVLVASAAYLTWLQYRSPYVLETDGYFHIKVAALIRERGVLREFPWAAVSLWADEYFDKDFLYHSILALFTAFELVTAAKVGAIFFGVVFFGSLFLVSSWTGVRRAWFWTLVVLLGSGPIFGWRVGVTRPQVWSMSLSLWALYFATTNAPRRLFVTSAIYALSYTAPHVAVGYGLIRALVSRVRDRSWVLWPVIAALLGMLTGWLLHPHFPANFVAFKIQIIDVLSSAWLRTGPDLHLGGEFRPLPWPAFLGDHALILICVGAAAVSAARRRRLPETRVLTIALAALVFLGLTLLSKRFVEYFVPFSVWASALVIEEELGEPGPIDPRRWSMGARILALGAAVTLVLLVNRSIVAHRREFRSAGAPLGEPAARWLAANTPENSRVFTCDWDDAPELFFFDHRNRYLVFLDPSFMYRWKPEVWTSWDATANGRGPKPSRQSIREAFGARYGFCTWNFGALLRELETDPKVRIELRSPGGYVFSIED
ncbi:MAG: hypothetical protein HY791_05790 [Deltaproteobacteria bacterium]|nr:hypothetical protein [Deltaproteobacteria bacterium]